MSKNIFKVVTAQYFLWYFCLLPLVAPHLKLTNKEIGLGVILWGFAQGSWLLPAYLLEFKGKLYICLFFFLRFIKIHHCVVQNFLSYYKKFDFSKRWRRGRLIFHSKYLVKISLLTTMLSALLTPKPSPWLSYITK